MPSSRHKKLKAALKRGFRKNESGRYALKDSPLWNLQSIHTLARLLRITPDELKEIAGSPAYNKFVDKPGTEKERDVQEPLAKTMRLHYRLVRLLDSISRPEFLHSATRKRSNVTNAAAHIAKTPEHAIVKTDIRKFYESTTYAHVKTFFHVDLGWPHDLARLTASACTVDGHLPTGSCLSPLLSYYAHRVLFEEVQEVCLSKGVTLTLYVDDLTLSGNKATKRLLHEIKTRIQRRGLTTHKDKFAGPNVTGVVTGIAVDGEKLRLRNKQHKAIVECIDNLVDEVGQPFDSLSGKLAAAMAVEPAAAAKLTGRLAKRINEIQNKG